MIWNNLLGLGIGHAGFIFFKYGCGWRRIYRPRTSDGAVQSRVALLGMHRVMIFHGSGTLHHSNEWQHEQ